MVVETDKLCGTAEVATVLGVLKQRIHTLRKRADFPKPIATLAATPVWNKDDIEAFKVVWRAPKQGTTTQA
jgi:predicted DNA-binding transcriptional regulator AlpA